jgi:hypothetical protein
MSISLVGDNLNYYPSGITEMMSLDYGSNCCNTEFFESENKYVVCGDNMWYRYDIAYHFL